MDEDNSSMTATRKFGIRAPDSVPSPVPAVEPSIFSVPSYTGSLSEADLFPESDLSNVGNTRPPQHLRHFAGSDIEKTYLTYFAAGDMHAYRHGTKVRVEGSTTHPAQLELLRDLFGGYAKPIFEPTQTPNGHCAIRATYDLSPSFDFLLKKLQRVERSVLREDELFYAALSGFSDAEGHAGLTKGGRRARAVYTLSNMNGRVMHDFLRGLNSREGNAHLYIQRCEEVRGQEKVQWQLNVHGAYALRLLPSIGFRHREKIVGRLMAMAHHGNLWNVAGPLYKAYRRAILVERSELEAVAARRWVLRNERKRRKREIFRQRVESSFELFSRGCSVQKVAETLDCSIRTAYRRKAKFRTVENKGRDST
jgi:hypothetical protein